MFDLSTVRVLGTHTDAAGLYAHFPTELVIKTLEGLGLLVTQTGSSAPTDTTKVWIKPTGTPLVTPAQVFAWSGTAWVDVASTPNALARVITTGQTRERLTANRTYYVRTDGSNSNTGLANTTAGAFLTIQKAVDVILGGLDIGTFNVTVQVAAGTYTASTFVNSAPLGPGTVTIQGDPTTPGNCIISTSGVCVSLNNGGRVTLNGFKLTSSGNRTLNVGIGALTYNNIEFGSASTDHILVGQGGSCIASGNSTISGNATVHWRAISGGVIQAQSRTITLTGTPAFSTAFAVATTSTLLVNANTFSGSATGTRYSATGNGVINTAGGGSTYLPGDASGSTATGGQYL